MVAPALMHAPPDLDPKRLALLERLGRAVPAFQSRNEDFDRAAALVLGLDARALRMADALREGPASLKQLSATLGLPERELRADLSRLALAGYARRVQHADRRAKATWELTGHAAAWSESLWGPLRDEGFSLLARFGTEELASLVGFLEEAVALQQAHIQRLRALAREPQAVRGRNRPGGGLSPAALRRVQLFAYAHLQRPVRVAEMAQRAGLSTFHFARAFHTTTGETPQRFLQRLRVEKAERLVRETDLPLAEVALAAGFSSQSRLTRAFRLALGATPARYRRDRKR